MNGETKCRMLLTPEIEPLALSKTTFAEFPQNQPTFKQGMPLVKWGFDFSPKIFYIKTNFAGKGIYFELHF